MGSLSSGQAYSLKHRQKVLQHIFTHTEAHLHIICNEIDTFVGLFCCAVAQGSTHTRYMNTLVRQSGLLSALEKPELHSNYARTSKFSSSCSNWSLVCSVYKVFLEIRILHGCPKIPLTDSITCRFHYMALADDRRRFMPLPDDRLPGRGQPLAYPEAVLLVNPVEPELKGEVSSSSLSFLI